MPDADGRSAGRPHSGPLTVVLSRSIGVPTHAQPACPRHDRTVDCRDQRARRRPDRRPRRRPAAYPQTRTVAQVDDYFGTKVADPYRWLEDDNAADTKAWVEAQNAVTFGYLGKIAGRDAIRTRLTKLWNYERYGLPRKRGERYFFTRNDGLQNQAVYYRAHEPRRAARSPARPEHAVGRRHGRGRRHDVLRRRALHGVLAVRERLGLDPLEGARRRDRQGPGRRGAVVKFSGAAWLHDGSGFFYSRYDAPKAGEALTGVNKNQKVYFHRLGTPQDADVLDLRAPRPAGLGLRRRRHRRRQVPADLPERRHRPEEPHLRQGPHPPRQPRSSRSSTTSTPPTTSSATTARPSTSSPTTTRRASA